jgi:hypothetical protein
MSKQSTWSICVALRLPERSYDTVRITRLLLYRHTDSVPSDSIIRLEPPDVFNCTRVRCSYRLAPFTRSHYDVVFTCGRYGDVRNFIFIDCSWD